MKKYYLIAGILVALALFFYPKQVSTGAGFAYPGQVYDEHACLGFGSYADIPDGTILTCYGMPYRAATKTW